MEAINEKDFRAAKRLDPHYILKLVKEVKNDAELGGTIRGYVNATLREE